MPVAGHLFGMMQGRFSPPTGGRIQSFPKKSWREEFTKAREAGLDLIEWIFEADAWQKNPLASDQGIAEILSISRTTGVQVQSICADYFMDLPLLRISDEQRNERMK